MKLIHPFNITTSFKFGIISVHNFNCVPCEENSIKTISIEGFVLHMKSSFLLNFPINEMYIKS